MTLRTTARLALGELEALACALLAVLLAFLHAGIASQKTVLAQRGTQFRVEAADGARQSHAHRSGLPANAAALGGAHHVDLVHQAGEFERLSGVMLPGMIREIFLSGAAVDRELAAAGAQRNTRNGFLAAARAVKPCFIAKSWRASKYSKILLKNRTKKRLQKSTK